MIVYIENQTKEFFDFRGYKKLITNAVCTVEEQKGIPSGLEVNVMIVSPETIQEINKETRGIDHVTDVLSFPYFDFEEPGKMDGLEALLAENDAGAPFPDDDGFGLETILGDIVICADQVALQAKEFGHSQKRELAYLVVHSMLHLIGYDHMTPEEETRMTEEAGMIMEVLGINR